MIRKGGGRESELDVTMHDGKRTQFSLEIKIIFLRWDQRKGVSNMDV